MINICSKNVVKIQTQMVEGSTTWPKAQAAAPGAGYPVTLNTCRGAEEHLIPRMGKRGYDPGLKFIKTCSNWSTPCRPSSGNMYQVSTLWFSICLKPRVAAANLWRFEVGQPPRPRQAEVSSHPTRERDRLTGFLCYVPLALAFGVLNFRRNDQVQDLFIKKVYTI